MDGERERGIQRKNTTGQIILQCSLQSSLLIKNMMTKQVIFIYVLRFNFILGSNFIFLCFSVW